MGQFIGLQNVNYKEGFSSSWGDCGDTPNYLVDGPPLQQAVSIGTALLKVAKKFKAQTDVCDLIWFKNKDICFVGTSIDSLLFLAHCEGPGSWNFLVIE